MSDIIQTAGAASPDAAGVAAHPESQTPTPEQRVAAAAAAMVGQAVPKPAVIPAKPAEPQPSMAELIRAQREARQSAQAETQKRTSLEQELTAARAELARAKADRQAFEDDPVGYAKERGWSQEQQLLYGQSLLYDLAPDKADPDFRLKMFEDRQKRKETAAAKEAQSAHEKAQQAAIKQQLVEFYQETAQAVQTFEAGSFPESQVWFEGDHDSYVQSLMATAKNVAAKATAEGRVADLTPAALAAVLEADVAARMSRRDQRKQTRAPERAAEPVKAAIGVQAMDTMNTRNLNGSGIPQPPAMSEKERIQRAINAGFRNR